VYGTTEAVGGPNATLTNVAYQKMAVADSESTTVYTASKAVDGDSASTVSQWISNANPGMHWLAIDLAGDYLTSAVNVVSNNLGMTQGLCQYAVQVSHRWSNAVVSYFLIVFRT
jgi:hypothetical protein